MSSGSRGSTSSNSSSTSGAGVRVSVLSYLQPVCLSACVCVRACVWLPSEVMPSILCPLHGSCRSERERRGGDAGERGIMMTPLMMMPLMLLLLCSCCTADASEREREREQEARQKKERSVRMQREMDGVREEWKSFNDLERRCFSLSS